MSVSAKDLENIERQRKLFDALDVGQKGYLTLADFHRALHFLGSDNNFQHAVQSFKLADKDSDQKLTFHEFVNLNSSVRDSILDKHSEPPVFGLFVGNPDYKPSRVPSLISASDSLPVLLVPGLTGSAIKRADKDQQLWFPDWRTLLMGLENCLGAVYDPNSHTVDGALPAEVIPGTEGVKEANYFVVLISALSASGVSAATYDWRFAPQQSTLDTWVTEVKKEVNQLRKDHGNKKVVILAHSLGNLMTLALFKHQKPWVEENIAGFISVSPPYGGAGLAAHAMVAPIKPPGIEFITLPSDFVNKFPSLGWMLPFEHAFPGQTVLKYKGTPYTASQIPEFLRTNETTSAVVGQIYDHSVAPQREYIQDIPPVPVFLVNSHKIRTQIGVDFTDDKHFTAIWEEGDNLGDSFVPYASLHANDKAWKIPESHIFEILDADHNSICDKDSFIAVVGKILSDLNRQQRHTSH